MTNLTYIKAFTYRLTLGIMSVMSLVSFLTIYCIFLAFTCFLISSEHVSDSSV